MTHLKSPVWVTGIVLVLVLTGLTVTEASRALVQTQEAERILEIERYPDEPLQLVNLRIGVQSVKDRIKPKFKDKISKWGTDSVKFNEKDDWFKRVSITMRNTSDKPIYGLEAYLFFKPAGFPMIFSLSLIGSKELGRDPLLPGAEIELSVNPGLLNHTLSDVDFRGVDLRHALLSFSLDTVIFADDSRWYRGKLLRPDSAIPGKWVPVDAPLAMKRSQPPAKKALFVPASFRPGAPSKHSAPVVFSTCTQWNESYVGFPCNGEFSPDCIRRVDLDDNVNPGLLSHVSVSGLCIMDNLSGQSCQTSTTHTRLQADSNCQVCPDADNDGFQSAACGGTDCNDSSASINPDAQEDCEDGFDNNCDGCSCDMWSEGPIWQGGSGLDCEKCNDGVNNDCDEGADDLDPGCSLCEGTPVLVDVSGNGFDLSNAVNGVNFDLNSDGAKEKLSWTLAQTDDAWLALDRNGDGVINDGTELFGNFTPQSDPPPGLGRNGFNALVEYDRAAKGGNGDGLISDHDTVFGNLLLWQDKNHNGVSEANELHTLKQLGLTAIECSYKESKRRDQHGNQFRYRAKIIDTRNTQIGRWAWDVILVREQISLGNPLFQQVNWRMKPSVLEWLWSSNRASEGCKNTDTE
jgi:hypothetical protein